MPVHIGEALFEAVVVLGETLVVETDQVHLACFGLGESDRGLALQPLVLPADKLCQSLAGGGV